jgi:hypothetical protein
LEVVAVAAGEAPEVKVAKVVKAVDAVAVVPVASAEEAASEVAADVDKQPLLIFVRLFLAEFSNYSYLCSGHASMA